MKVLCLRVEIDAGPRETDLSKSHKVLNAALPDEDFDLAVKITEDECGS